MQFKQQHIPPDHECPVCRDGAPQPAHRDRRPGGLRPAHGRCPVAGTFEKFKAELREALRAAGLWGGVRALEALVTQTATLFTVAPDDGDVDEGLPLGTYLMARAVAQERAKVRARALWTPPEGAS